MSCRQHCQRAESKAGILRRAARLLDQTNQKRLVLSGLRHRGDLGRGLLQHLEVIRVESRQSKSCRPTSQTAATRPSPSHPTHRCHCVGLTLQHPQSCAVDVLGAAAAIARHQVKRVFAVDDQRVISHFGFRLDTLLLPHVVSLDLSLQGSDEGRVVRLKRLNKLGFRTTLSASSFKRAFSVW